MLEVQCLGFRAGGGGVTICLNAKEPNYLLKVPCCDFLAYNLEVSQKYPFVLYLLGGSLSKTTW